MNHLLREGEVRWVGFEGEESADMDLMAAGGEEGKGDWVR